MATPDQRIGPFSPEKMILRLNEAIINREQMTQLIGLNANTGNLNRKNYELKFGLHGEKFKPLSYDPINVVWVQTSSGEKKLFIVDGHHRAGVLHKHWEQIHAAYPDFHPTLRNVTEDYLPSRDTPSQAQESFSEVLGRAEGLIINAPFEEEPPAITTREYLKILTEPTIAQSEILSLRVALTLIERWDGVLESEDLANKFPAMAALAFLQQDALKSADVDRGDTFFTGDTAEERVMLRDGIHVMAKILHDNDTTAATVLTSAFVVVSVKDDFLNAKDRAETQLRGLLRLPVITAKLEDRSALIPRDKREENLYASLRYGVPWDRSQAEIVGEDILKALFDQELSFSETVRVLQTKQKKKKHQEILTEHRVEELKRAYAIFSGKDQKSFTSTEENVLIRLCGTETLDRLDVQGYCNLVSSVGKLLQNAENLQVVLSDAGLALDAEERKGMRSELTKNVSAVHRRKQHFLVRSIFALQTQIDIITAKLTVASTQTASAHPAETVYSASATATSVASKDEGKEINGATVQADLLAQLDEKSRLLEDQRRELALLREEAWWMSGDYTPKEQALIRAYNSATFSAYCEAQGITTEEGLEIRKQMIFKHRRRQGRRQS